MQKIVTSLWFDGNAEEAVNFYTSVFKNSKITDISRYTEAGPGQPGTALAIMFQLNGIEYMAINGGPEYTFTPAISLMVNCETQQEIDSLWEQLTAGGREDQCGWLTDKYGLSWQIVPANMGQLMQSKDPEKARRATEAMFKMKKLDIKTLQEA
ncbi:VOC family protein [Dictyobacter alpinus]|uniref:VOC family protein n=1 Tax=Dictyobacter alpinus TaxID=2014873 RepID=A0A402BC39_9CHLR|nr:VOC family protein [Dictyobacter alpinus]GCE28862.1 VOC family protein [Dictyobacter alpinus]